MTGLTETLDSVSQVNSMEDISISSIQPITSNRSAESLIQNNPSPENEFSTHDDPILNKYKEACQHGDLVVVKEMLETGLIDVRHDYTEKERISGLHWASINNRLSVVKYLVAKGADVNFPGGGLNATPLHWAARYGYVYIVDFLLENKADPNLTDDQGFNLLHLSINSSNIMLVLYVLFFVVGEKVSIDCTDPNGRTALLWAAYQGDSLSVAALLYFKANYKIVDNKGFSPLHWGTVKGQPQVLKELIANGADFFQKTSDNKDCFAISQEMNTVESLNSALYECGFNKEGYPITRLFKRPTLAKIVTFIIPWLAMGIIFKSIAILHPILSICFAILFGFGVYQFLARLVIPSYYLRKDRNLLLKTPFFAGILSATLFWTSFIWIIKMISFTISEEPKTNALFMFFLVMTTTLFIKLVSSDPGSIPKESDHDKIKSIIKQLLETGKFDAKHFCIHSFVRKPLRSKYSSFSKALVARFDHFCPWIYNDVGLKNHKNFLFFILCLEMGVLMYAKLSLEYFDALEDKYDKDPECWLLSEDLCSGYHYDRFAFILLGWTCFQGIWVFSLIVVQFFQMLKGLTNYELGDLSKQAHSHNIINEYFTTTPTELMDEQELRDMNEPALEQQSPLHHKSRTCFGMCCALIGFDQMVLLVKETLGLVQRSERRPVSRLKVPSDYGWRTNLKDFWLTSDTTAPLWQRLCFSPTNFKALLNGTQVNYAELYNLPERYIRPEEIV